MFQCPPKFLVLADFTLKVSLQALTVTTYYPALRLLRVASSLFRVSICSTSSSFSRWIRRLAPLIREFSSS